MYLRLSLGSSSCFDPGHSSLRQAIILRASAKKATAMSLGPSSGSQWDDPLWGFEELTFALPLPSLPLLSLSLHLFSSSISLSWSLSSEDSCHSLNTCSVPGILYPFFSCQLSSMVCLLISSIHPEWLWDGDSGALHREWASAPEEVEKGELLLPGSLSAHLSTGPIPFFPQDSLFSIPPKAVCENTVPIE